jgi:peptide/nickel transport system permease protein
VQDTQAQLQPVLPHTLPSAADQQYDVAVKQIGQWRLVWRRFKRHRLALIGSLVLLLMIVLAIVGPFIAPAFVIYPYGLFKNTDLSPRLLPFSIFRLLGTDHFGEPVSYYVLNGGRATLVIGIVGALIASIVGTMIGSIAGYFGRFVDTALMRLTDAFLTVPFLPLLILLALYLPDHGMVALAILFGIVGWAGVARLVRGYVLSLQQREFAEAARALGVSDLGVIFRHLLPNCIDILIVSFTLNIALFMLTAANLGYLGAGTTDITWAQEIGFSVLGSDWWPMVFCGVPLLLTVLATNLVGDGLRDAFDTSSTGALIKWKDRPDRIGRLERLAILLAGVVRPPLTAGRRALAAPFGRLALPARRPAISSRVTAAMPARADHYRAGRLARTVDRTPLVLRVAPPVAVILAGMVVFLYSHSPLRYAPHFAAPTVFGRGEGQSGYGMKPLIDGGWAILADSPGSNLTFTKSDRSGRIQLSQIVVRNIADTAEPSLAARHNWALAAWLSNDNATVLAAFVGAHHSRPFALTPPGGVVEHPYAVRVPGGFDVLFDWQHPGSAHYQIFAASIRDGNTHPALHRLLTNKDYGLLPRGIADGSGALNVLSLDRLHLGLWAWRFRRYRPDGTPISPLTTLGTVDYAPISRATGRPDPNIIPSTWGFDLREATDGSIWAAWESRSDGIDAITVAHWSRTGRSLLPPTQVMQGGFDIGTYGEQRSLSLAVLRRGGQLYFTGPSPDGGSGTVPFMQPFSADGTPIGLPQRVSYDGGVAALPHAGSIQGKARVLWEKLGIGATIFEGTAYGPYRPPDLLTRLGLNIGSLPVNVGLLLVGALAGGIGVAIVNVFLLLLFLLLWLPIGRLPRVLRWPLYSLALAVVIVDVFGIHASDPPNWIFLISGLGSPENWMAVAAAIFTALWAGIFFFRRYESVFRAAAMAFTAIYVVGVMYAVVFIQGEITRI